MATELEKATKSGKSLERAVVELLPKVIEENKRIIFNGNNYAKEWEKAVAESVAAVKAAGGKAAESKRTLDKITKLIDLFRRRTDKLAKALEHESNGATEKHAKYMRDAIVPAMAALRDAGDALKVIMPHETWPLATYREMLFIK